MNFINPLFLFGLIAASIPVLLHLLNLRKLKNIEFSSLKFLKELQKTKIKRLKIKQIILLILRTLIITFTVLAFARPIIEGSIPGFENYAKSSIIILIDNSYSMDISDEFGNRFIQAKKSAEKIINSMKEGDEALILEMSGSNSTFQPAFTKNKDLLIQSLSQIKLQPIPASLDNSMRLAGKYFQNANNFAKELFIISDAQKNVFHSEDMLKLNNKNIAIYFIPIGYSSSSNFENLSVDSVDVLTKFFSIGKSVELSVTVKNHSDKDVKGALISLLFNKQKVAQKTFDISANSAKSIPIAAQIQKPGVVSAAIELENDAFIADNNRYFGFIVPEKPNVAIFGETTNNFFLKALFSTDDAQNQINVSFYDENSVDNLDLNKFDCLVLNFSNFSESKKNRIKEYVSSGGSSIFFPSDQTNDNYRNFLAEFGFALSEKKSFSEKSPASFSALDAKHPIFDGMFKLAGEGITINQIDNPKIFSILPVNTGVPIIESQDGYFLSENQFGDGKCLYFAVAPNLYWSNFPLLSLFPSLIFRSVFYLSSSITLGYSFDIGSNQTVMIPRKLSPNQNFKLIDPSGNQTIMQLPLLQSGAALSLELFNETGVYQLINSQNKIAYVFSLNMPKSESYIQKPDVSNLLSHLYSRTTYNKNIFILTNYSQLSQDLKRARIGTELWSIMLFLAILCAIAEMIVQKVSKNEEFSE